MYPDSSITKTAFSLDREYERCLPRLQAAVLFHGFGRKGILPENDRDALSDFMPPGFRYAKSYQWFAARTGPSPVLMISSGLLRRHTQPWLTPHFSGQTRRQLEQMNSEKQQCWHYRVHDQGVANCHSTMGALQTKSRTRPPN